MTDKFQYVRKHVREVPDFPKKGILFLDITTATKDAKAMQYMTDFLYEQFKDEKIDYVTGTKEISYLLFGENLPFRNFYYIMEEE